MNAKTKTFLIRMHQICKNFGLDPILFFKSLYGLWFFMTDYFKLRKLLNGSNIFPLSFPYPILNERFSEAGTMSGHYFHQDLYVARKIFENNPIKHLDIGSRIDGFVAHVAVFREILVVDIREQTSMVKNIFFKKADLMKLPEELINTFDSISTLHAIEHFGLGRYGDPIDPLGYLKAIENIYSLLIPGGKLYFSVPIGTQRIEFNAHRVFSVNHLLEIFKGRFKLDTLSYVSDNGQFYENVEINESSLNTNFGCNFGCGIFELTKI
jgi:SAM-dependent methyltransferase